MEPLISKEKIEKAIRIYDQFHKVQLDYFEFWKVNTFMHWDFWVSLMLTIVPWIMWAKFHRRQSRYRLLFVAFYIIIITCYLDFLGIVFAAWCYTGKVFPTIPNYLPWDFTLFPVTIISLIQFKPHISPMFKGFAFAAVASFILEPLFELIGFYHRLRWKSIYSFPIYILIYLSAQWLSKREYFERID